jgi:hypothetical protein
MVAVDNTLVKGLPNQVIYVERYRPLAVGVKGLAPCSGVQRDEKSLCKKGGGNSPKGDKLVADHRPSALADS